MPETTTQQQTSAIIQKLPGTNITRALLAVQMSLNPVQKTGKNPHRKSDYATLNDVLDELLPCLNANGLILLQRTLDVDANGIVKVETLVIHAETAEFITEITPMDVPERGAQAVGSGITYARRYALMTLFAMKTSDDDGSMATPGQGRQDYRNPPQVTQRPAQPPQRSGVQERSPRSYSPPDELFDDPRDEPHLTTRREPIVQPTVVNIPPRQDAPLLPTDRQLEVIDQMGYDGEKPTTRADASALIGKLKARR